MWRCASSLQNSLQELRQSSMRYSVSFLEAEKVSLELQEDVDILEAGIRIIAQPPGKKLQNMMQLSGGEKALTAIALLFAIQNLKPSPFCLLDEIEAALDDNNVDRYAQYLHKLDKIYAVHCHYPQTWNNGSSRPAVWYYHAGKRSIYTGICRICWKMNWISRREEAENGRRKKDFLNDLYPVLQRQEIILYQEWTVSFMDFPGLMMTFMKNWKKL